MLVFLASASLAFAQIARAPSLPTLRPTVTVLGEARPELLPYDSVSLSPDGHLIVYCTPRDVHIWNVATHEDAVLFGGNAHTLAWGPKGDMLVFQTHANGHVQFGDMKFPEDAGLYTIRLNPETGKAVEPPRLAAKVPVNHGVFLSPDEQTIAFTQYFGSYVTSLAVVPVAGGPPRTLASAIEIQHVAWDATGQYLYYSGYDSVASASRLEYRVALADGRHEHVEEHRSGGDAWGLRDMTTGKTVAWLSVPPDIPLSDWGGVLRPPRHHRLRVAGVQEAHPRGVRLLNLADGTARDLLDPGAEAGSPTWFADGSRIAMLVRREGDTELVTARPDGSDIRHYRFSRRPRLSGALRDDAALRISPDGRYLAFKTDESIELMDLASGRQRMLVRVGETGAAPEGQGIGPIAWANDAKRIFYFAGVYSSEPAVHLITLAGVDKVVRKLPMFVYGSGPMSFSSSQQPEFVEFPRLRTGRGAVTLVPLAGGPPRVLLPEPDGFNGPLSPDGKTLVIPTGAVPTTGVDNIKLALIAADGSKRQPLALPFVPLLWPQWHPDGKRLLVLGREKAGAPVNIYSVPTDGSAPAKIAALGDVREPGSFSPAAMAVSPDGKFVAVTVAGEPRTTFVELEFDVSIVAGARR